MLGSFNLKENVCITIYQWRLIPYKFRQNYKVNINGDVEEFKWALLTCTTRHSLRLNVQYLERSIRHHSGNHRARGNENPKTVLLCIMQMEAFRGQDVKAEPGIIIIF